MQSESKGMICSVVTPNQEIWQGAATSVTVPGEIGYIEVLPGHSPLVSALRPGFLKIKDASSEKDFFVSGGFLNVTTDSVLVLAEVAETKSQINRQRAEEAKERAEARLSSKDEVIDLNRAQEALLRALMRIEFLEHSKNHS